MAEARITEFFGETHIREEVLDFMELRSCMPREAWRLPSPQMLQKNSVILASAMTQSGVRKKNGHSESPTLNRRGSPWVGNDPKSPKLGALIRRLGLGNDPKQARVALGRKWP